MDPLSTVLIVFAVIFFAWLYLVVNVYSNWIVQTRLIRFGDACYRYFINMPRIVHVILLIGLCILYTVYCHEINNGIKYFAKTCDHIITTSFTTQSQYKTRTLDLSHNWDNYINFAYYNRYPFIRGEIQHDLNDIELI